MPALRAAAQHGLMWAIRLAPLPWSIKRWAIRIATPHTLVVATALIPDADGRVLLLRARYSGRWILPGGAMHPGEDPLTGVCRECREELGRDIRPTGLVGLYAFARSRELYVVFRCAPLTGPPRLSAEHQAFRYVPPPELPRWLRGVWDDARRLDTDGPAVRTLP
jgi:8-oxo-dGTP diphosphatase